MAKQYENEELKQAMVGLNRIQSYTVPKHECNYILPRSRMDKLIEALDIDIPMSKIDHKITGEQWKSLKTDSKLMADYIDYFYGDLTWAANELHQVMLFIFDTAEPEELFTKMMYAPGDFLMPKITQVIQQYLNAEFAPKQVQAVKVWSWSIEISQDFIRQYLTAGKIMIPSNDITSLQLPFSSIKNPIIIEASSNGQWIMNPLKIAPGIAQEIIEVMELQSSARYEFQRKVRRRTENPEHRVKENGLVPIEGQNGYLNAALQCLFHVPGLVDYFISEFDPGRFLNTENPRGTGGQLVLEFAKVLYNSIRSAVGSTALYSSEKLLTILASFTRGLKNPRPSDELLAAEKIVGLLHEDLNQSLKPPPDSHLAFIENPTELLQENWNEYKETNNSKIIDIFGGQALHTYICRNPAWMKLSYRLQPFRYLELEVPQDADVIHEVFFVPLSEDPVCNRVSLAWKFYDTVSNLNTRLQEAVGIPQSTKILYAIFEDFELKCWVNHSDAVESLSEVLLGQQSLKLYAFQANEELEKNSVFAYFVRKEKHSYRSESLMETVLKFPILVTRTENHEYIFNVFMRVFEPDFDILKEIFKTDLEAIQQKMEDEGKECYLEEALYQIHDKFLKIQLYTTADDFEYLQVSNELDYFSQVQPIEPQRFVNVNLQVTGSNEGTLTLEDCIRNYTNPRPAGDAICPLCKQTSESNQVKIEISRLPNVLIFIIQKFAKDEHGKEVKSDWPIRYSLRALNMQPYYVGDRSEGEKMDYECVSAASHLGIPEYAHYEATSKVQYSSQWLKFADTEVSEVAEHQIMRSDAFSLFYVRRTIDRVLNN